ncbi:MAG: NAD(P)/FAD-dependent oxidoreductase [Cytophagaceae bacterium]|nr:NAD(P)/FAD-dependent oxidoreductase [Cytophagaceae bacterium]
MKKYDLCVIGGGPAGYAAAMRALDLKKSVCLVEKNRVGGAGLYNGALSSKTFWEISMEIASVRKRLHKYSEGDLKIDFKDILNDVHDAIFLRKIQLETHLLLLQRKRKDVFDTVKAQAYLKTNHEVILQKGGDEEIIYAENILIATGSRPRKIPNIPIDEKVIVTSDGIESFTDFPESMVILGAGVIGCEWATIFSNIGRTHVNIIDKADRILPFEDEDVSFTIQSHLEDHGVTIHRNSKLERMEIKNGKVEYELIDNDGNKNIFTVEKALVAVGREPNIEGTGLKELGIKLKPSGTIEDNDTQTSIPNIYAAGDITSDIALVSIAEMEGRHAVEKMFGATDKILAYKNISTIMFLNPETAGVGMNEQEARKKGICFKVVSMDYSLIPRAVAMRSTKGFFKILVSNDDEMRILGMRAVGEHASTAIQAVALLIQMDKGIEDLAELIHPHPSIIEGIQECLRMLTGKSILKPEIFKDTLKCKGCTEKGEYYDIDF